MRKKQQRFTVSTLFTLASVAIFAIWYIWLHRYRSGGSTPDGLRLAGVIAVGSSLLTLINAITERHVPTPHDVVSAMDVCEA